MWSRWPPERLERPLPRATSCVELEPINRGIRDPIPRRDEHLGLQRLKMNALDGERPIRLDFQFDGSIRPDFTAEDRLHSVSEDQVRIPSLLPLFVPQDPVVKQSVVADVVAELRAIRGGRYSLHSRPLEDPPEQLLCAIRPAVPERLAAELESHVHHETLAQGPQADGRRTVVPEGDAGKKTRSA